MKDFEFKSQYLTLYGFLKFTFNLLKMRYSHEVIDGVLVLYFEGDLIGENHGAALVALANEHISDDINLCVIDLSKVRYINSSGIGVLITLLTKFRNKEGEVFLVKPSITVEKLLIITKLNSIFQIADTVNAAISELKKTA